MNEFKFVKGKCKKTGVYYGLDMKQVGGAWKVVNMFPLSDEEASLTTSEVRQPDFETHTNLLACSQCGGRKVGGCSCPSKKQRCSASMKYNFECIYCKEFEVDYQPGRGAARRRAGETITLSQGKEVKIITFSNVEWKKFDKIQIHPSGARYREPSVHVAASETNIEFHGYNVSRMDEGVYYPIDKEDDFEIECDVDTSTIMPHPGGHLYVDFGSIEAKIDLGGGSICLNGRQVAKVGSRFHMKLSYIDHTYAVEIDGAKKGEQSGDGRDEIRVTFGFAHDSHDCHILSHAYMRGIQMRHGTFGAGEQ